MGKRKAKQGEADLEFMSHALHSAERSKRDLSPLNSGVAAGGQVLAGKTRANGGQSGSSWVHTAPTQPTAQLT